MGSATSIDHPFPSLAFVHVPKTAGTSVTDALCRAYADATFPGMTTLDYQAAVDEELSRYKFFKGHMYVGDYRRLPAGTKKFTILRNPTDHAASLYYYYRNIDPAAVDDPYMREAVENARNGSIVEFLYSPSPFVIEHVRYGQIRQFLSLETLHDLAHRQFVSDALKSKMLAEFKAEIDQFDACLTYELLHWLFPLLVERLGLPVECHHLDMLNRSERQAVKQPERLLRAVVDVSDIEFICYDYVRERELQFLAG